MSQNSNDVGSSNASNTETTASNTSCPFASIEDKRRCKEALEGAKKKKTIKKEDNETTKREVDIQGLNDIERIEGGGLGNKRPRTLGPMDRYISHINPDETFQRTTAQQNINDALFKERTHQVHQYLARWVYETGIPFDAVDNDSFKSVVEAVGQFGPGYQPPSQHQLGGPLLKEEVDQTKSLLKTQEEEWEKNGCSIITDAWSDRNKRSIMNLCINSRSGTTFLSSKEASGHALTGEYIFQYVNECIESVGEKNVVQVVTDNASNNMAAAMMMSEKRPQIFWTPCAFHSINLMLETVGKLSTFKNIIMKAKTVTKFIYSHHATLSLMRKCTKGEMIQPGVTSFTTTFLTLQSFIEKKWVLRQMVSSDAWDAVKWSKCKKGKAAYVITVQPTFWSDVALTLNVFAPLVRVLRLVDGDVEPAMAFVYGELKKAKNEIKETLENKEDKYKPILDIVDSKGKGCIDTPLHLTAYLFNPYYYYKDVSTWSSEERVRIMDGLFDCVERLIPDIDIQQEVVNVELVKYKDRKGAFGRPLAIRECEQFTYDPVEWWSNYGYHTPNLQKIAIRILSLTTSSSGCERNRSVFEEGIHTKKRNRLDTDRMKKLVYVQFNSRLTKKKKRVSDQVDALLATTAHNAQSWIVDGLEDEEVTTGSGLTSGVVDEASGANEELQSRRSARDVEEAVRELEEDDFLSADDSVVDSDDEFENFYLEMDKECIGAS